MFYHARAAYTECKYLRNPAARAKKSPKNAVSAFRHESVHRVIRLFKTQRLLIAPCRIWSNLYRRQQGALPLYQLALERNTESFRRLHMPTNDDVQAVFMYTELMVIIKSMIHNGRFEKLLSTIIKIYQVFSEAVKC